MNWDDWQRAELASLRGLLRQHYDELAAARLVWLKVGRPPDDPLLVDLHRSIARTAETGRRVADEIISLAPYRPLVSPWKTQSLVAVLRPDFKTTGITDRE